MMNIRQEKGLVMRYIQNKVEDPLAEKLLEGAFHAGDTLVIVTTGRGSIRQINDIFA